MNQAFRNNLIKVVFMFLFTSTSNYLSAQWNPLTKVSNVQVPYKEGDVAISTKYVINTFKGIKALKAPMYIKMISPPAGGSYSDATMERIHIYMFYLSENEAFKEIDMLLPSDDNIYLINSQYNSNINLDFICKIDRQNRNIELKINKMSNDGVYFIETKSLVTDKYVQFVVWKPKDDDPNIKINSPNNPASIESDCFRYDGTRQDSKDWSINQIYKVTRQCRVSFKTIGFDLVSTYVYGPGDVFYVKKGKQQIVAVKCE